MNTLTPEEARMIYFALRRHDGQSLSPEIDPDQARKLTAALDKLRQILLDVADQAVNP